jgi:hypothetical protein
LLARQQQASLLVQQLLLLASQSFGFITVLHGREVLSGSENEASRQNQSAAKQ